MLNNRSFVLKDLPPDSDEVITKNSIFQLYIILIF
jgi:hypothetical protein